MANSSEEKHEVFICFRGEDTRNTFTSHLNAAIRRVAIRTYIDHDLRRGEEIPQRLLKAIKDAKLSVIVFSENFASSKWCLDEVVNILECKKRNNQIVVPVFYRVDPAVVRNQIGIYGEAFAKHEHRFEGEMNKVRKWREALTEAANHSGWECSLNKVECEVVEGIAKDVIEKLNHVYIGDLDEQIRKFEQLAELQNQYYKAIPELEYLHIYQATVRRITELKMKRSIRLLRLTPDMLPYVGNFKSDPDFD
ncbi:hypothetical protein PIB30_006790 [Stylosanthes scabra]|uniref:TIR domain-containing protein n=1 Tax=Stylosanthes scabra TaxID=79078 RepID=A0ABU6U5Y6_9FABA|nr:hypothetical protein [Stylosanthes scabra]